MRETLILGDLEDEFASRLMEMTYAWHMTLGKPTGWEEDSSGILEHQREAVKAWKEVGKYLLPWRKEFRETAEKSLERLWRDFKEEEKDPEFGAWLRDERRKLNERGKTAGLELDALAMAARRLKKMREERERSAGLRGRKKS